MVNQKLIETISWDEFIQKVQEYSNDYTPGFKTWLKERERLKGTFFDGKMYRRLYKIFKDIKNDKDHFVVIVGGEGDGKSTLGIQISCVLDLFFCLKRIFYKPIPYLDAIPHLKPGEACLLDEGVLFLFSRDAASDENKKMLKLFALMRQMNLVTVICIPNFWVLESYVRNHRVDTLIHVRSRGKYTGYSGLAIKILSKEGAKFKSFNNIRVPHGTYWNGYFNSQLPSCNDITPEDYKAHKAESFKEFLSEVKTELQEKEGSNSKYVSLTQATGIVPLSKNTLIKMLREGSLPGRQLGAKWFIERGALEEL